MAENKKPTLEEFLESPAGLRVGEIPRSAEWSSEYDHLGVWSQDVANMVALDMQANAGSYVMGKVAAAGLGAISGGTLAGLGFIGMNMAQDMWAWYKATSMAEDPTTFWNKFKKNMEEAKSENSAIDDFMEGFQTRSSFVGGAATQDIYNERGQAVTPMGEMPQVTDAHKMGDLLGYVVRDAAFMLGTGEWGLIGLSALHNGMQEYTQELGFGHKASSAAKSGALYGLATGATGLAFMKLIPGATKYLGGQMANGTIGTALQALSPEKNPLVNSAVFGLEFAAWGGSEEALLAIADGRDIPLSPTQLGVMFGAGMALSGLGKLGKLFGKTGGDIPKQIVPERSQGLIPYRTGAVAEQYVQQQLGSLPAHKLSGRFAEEVLSPQEIALAAEQMRDMSMMRGFSGAVDGTIIQELLTAKGTTAYNAFNAEKLAEEFTRIAPNMDNPKSFMKTAGDWTEYVTTKVSQPVYLDTPSTMFTSPTDVIRLDASGTQPAININEKGNYFFNREPKVMNRRTQNR